MPGPDDETAEWRRDVIRDLVSSTTGLDRTLERAIPLGVAFHHAGMCQSVADLLDNRTDFFQH